MIAPENIPMKRADGSDFVLVVSKLPAIPAREIVSQYVTTAIPKIGDYQQNEKLMKKLLAYAGIQLEDGTIIRFTNDALINNHLVDWETLVTVEWKMLEYNTSFLKKLNGQGGLKALMKMAKPALTKALQNMKSSLSKEG